MAVGGARASTEAPCSRHPPRGGRTFTVVVADPHQVTISFRSEISRRRPSCTAQRPRRATERPTSAKETVWPGSRTPAEATASGAETGSIPASNGWPATTITMADTPARSTTSAEWASETNATPAGARSDRGCGDVEASAHSDCGVLDCQYPAERGRQTYSWRAVSHRRRHLVARAMTIYRPLKTDGRYRNGRRVWFFARASRDYLHLEIGPWAILHVCR